MRSSNPPKHTNLKAIGQDFSQIEGSEIYLEFTKKENIKWQCEHSTADRSHKN